MKKNFTRILAAVAASFAVLSCMQANLEEEPLNVLPNQYVATFESSDDEGSPDTKVSLASDNTTVTWDKGDVIEFINSMAQCVSTWQAGTVDQNGKRAVFDLKSGSAEEQATFAIYRGLSEGCSIGLSVNQPMMISFTMNEQTGLFEDANVMAAKVVDRTLEFKQVFGIFELEVTDSKVKKIVVEGPGIASTVEVTFYKGSSKALDNIKPVGSGRDAITVGNIKPGSWYVAVAPKSYDAGSITISYLDGNDAVVTSVKYPNLLTVGRKDIIAFGDISEHSTMSITLPDGKTFNNYMKQLAGELKNIKQINFYTTSSSIAGTKIAENVYMSFANGVISVDTSKSQFTANEDCSYMFNACPELITIIGLDGMNTSATTNMKEMFSDCAKLRDISTLKGCFTTANVTNMNDMFYNCETLEELDLSTWNTRKVTNMGYMFEWTWALKKVILGSNFVIPDGCFAEEMLFGCDATWYGTTEEMESFQKNLFVGSDYFDGYLHFAIDMGDAGWWSAWNVGAEKPTDFGYYFSWGNSAGHMKNGVSDGYSFSENDYKSTDGYSRTTDWQNAPYCDSQWRMPGTYDFENLKANSNVSRHSINGVMGTKFTHKNNGNSIFFPDAGNYAFSGHHDLSHYWTREFNNNGYGHVFCITDKAFYDVPPYYGIPVRPIAKLGDIPVEDIFFNVVSWAPQVGQELTITATVTPYNATNKHIIWSSSNTSVAKVTVTSETTAKVTALASGTTTISATTVDGSKTASIKITVKAEPLSGVFSISDTKKIRFSQGNLQAIYNGTNYDWGFAKNQYDFIGDAPGNTTIYSQTQGAVVDLFSWSTASTYYGIDKSYRDNDYSGDFVDWGTIFDNKGTWRTLTIDEWRYLFNYNGESNGTRRGLYAYGVTVAGKENCVVLYPDGYTGTIVSNGDMTSYNTKEKWAVAHNSGVVCLAAAGLCEGDSFRYDEIKGGYYWSSTALDYRDAYYLLFIEGAKPWTYYRGIRFSVRLVTDVK